MPNPPDAKCTYCDNMITTYYPMWHTWFATPFPICSWCLRKAFDKILLDIDSDLENLVEKTPIEWWQDWIQEILTKHIK